MSPGTPSGRRHWQGPRFGRGFAEMHRDAVGNLSRQREGPNYLGEDRALGWEGGRVGNH